LLLENAPNLIILGVQNMRRLMLYCAILLLSPLVGISQHYLATPRPSQTATKVAVTKGPQIPLPRGVTTDTYTTMVMSKSGEIGFLTSNYGGGLWAFNLQSGELQGQLLIGDRAGQLAIYERDNQRLLAVVQQPMNEAPQIKIVNAGQPRDLQLMTTITLPATTEMARTLKPLFTPDGRYLLLATTNPGNLAIWETATGRLVRQLELATGATTLTANFLKTAGLLALVHPATGKLSFVDCNLTDIANPQLALRHEISLPTDLGLISANNLSLDRRTKTGYIASFTGNKVLAVDLVSGEIRDTVAVGDAPARLARWRYRGQHYLAVVNTGLKHGFLADTVSLIELTKEGTFSSASVFIPPDKVDLTPDTGVDLSAGYGFVTGAHQIWAFDVATGDLLHTLSLPGKPTNFVMKGPAAKLWVLSQTNLHEHLNLYSFNTVATPTINNGQENRPDPAAPVVATTTSSATILKAKPKDLLATNATEAALPKGNSTTSAATLAPRISSARFLIDKRGLALSVIGKNFSPLAKVRVNNNNFAVRRETAERFLVRLPWRILRQGSYLSITVENIATDAEPAKVIEFKKPLKR
jgi:hypothetical protein